MSKKKILNDPEKKGDTKGGNNAEEGDPPRC